MHEAILIITGFLAGAAGPIGGVVSLVSFPILLALGYSPLVANVTNTVGVVSPGTMSSSVAYRKQIDVDRRLGATLFGAAAAGGLVGGLLLIALGNRFFTNAVPILLTGGAALILLQPIIVKKLASRHSHPAHRKVVILGTAVVSIYAGYFGAGAGVLIFSIYAIGLPGGAQKANALKSFVSVASNLAAAIYFVFAAPIAWRAALLLAIGSVGGSWVGVRIAQRIPDTALRIIVALGGLTTALIALH